MIAFTVDEARLFKKAIKNREEYKNEYSKFSGIVNLFSIWFLIITSIRSLFVFTIVISLFNNEPDLIYAWNQGYGFIGLVIYLIASCIDLMRLLDIGIIIAVVIGSFTVGNGIGTNFSPFILPIIICYALYFGIILASNYAINAILEKSCPKIYKEITSEIKIRQIRQMMNGGF